MEQEYPTETLHRVDRQRAFSHAQLTVRRDWAAGIHGFQQMHKAEIDPEPLTIHDLNGAELFYDFPLRQGDDITGWARTSASRILGSPVISVETRPRRWNADESIAAARRKALKAHPGTEITKTSLVCFSYPKIGVRIDFTGELNPSVIYDVGDLAEVKTFGPDEQEGFTAWSFYEVVAEPRADEKLNRWELADRELDAVYESNRDVLNTAFTERESGELRKALTLKSDYAFLPFYSSKVLKYSPRCSPHDCFMLYSQQTDVYCAVASGQMILDFHRWPFTQDQIATAMGTDAGGTSNPGQVAGYESLTNNSFDATFDDTADWAEAKAEIDANRPVKSGIPGHARACAGWKRQNIFLISQAPKRWLQIYDPWPWNADLCQGGAVVWEDWDAVTHTNFIYVRHA
jgi:hypothetical protein